MKRELEELRQSVLYPLTAALVAAVAAALPMILGLVVVSPPVDKRYYIAVGVGTALVSIFAWSSARSEQRRAKERGDELKRLQAQTVRLEQETVALVAERAKVANRSIALSGVLLLILERTLSFEMFVSYALGSLRENLDGIPGARVAFVAYATPVMSRVAGGAINLHNRAVAFQSIGSESKHPLGWTISTGSVDDAMARSLIEGTSTRDRACCYKSASGVPQKSDGFLLGPPNAEGMLPAMWYRLGLAKDDTFGVPVSLGFVAVDWWGSEELSRVDEELISDCARWIGLAFKFARLVDTPHRAII